MWFYGLTKLGTSSQFTVHKQEWSIVQFDYHGAGHNELNRVWKTTTQNWKQKHIFYKIKIKIENKNRMKTATYTC